MDSLKKAMENNVLLAKAYELLEPLGDEKRLQLMSWIQRETQMRPIVDHMMDDKDNQWDLFQQSPIHPSTVVMMLHWEKQRAVTVYTFHEVDHPTMGKGAQFFRQVIFNVARVHGPISYEALFEDFAAFMEVDDDDKPDDEAA